MAVVREGRLSKANGDENGQADLDDVDSSVKTAVPLD